MRGRCRLSGASGAVWGDVPKMSRGFIAVPMATATVAVIRHPGHL